MIDSVRNTVLALLNKNNRGYLSPSDFNLYAKQAQLELFNEYLYKYSYQINKENARQSGTEYADVGKLYQEVLEYFSVTNYLSNSSNNKFFLPSPVTTGDSYYTISRIICYPNVLTTGSSTSDSANKLVDTGATFVTSGVAQYDIVSNTTTEASSRVVSVTETEITLEDDIFTSSPEAYAVYDESFEREVEKVSNSRIKALDASLITKPNTTFPAYTLEGTLITMYPRSVTTYGAVEAQYIRYPLDPKWTWVSLSGGEPSFDQSDALYQDFELPVEDEYKLVAKICQYAGLEIREPQVVEFANREEVKGDQSEQ